MYVVGMATERLSETITAVDGGGNGNLCEMREMGIMIERGAGPLFKMHKSPSIQWCIGCKDEEGKRRE